MDNGYYIGLDVGGSFIKGAAVTPDGKLLDKESRPTESSSPNTVVIGNILKTITELMEKQKKDPLAIGMGIPGAVQFDTGVVSRSPHFPNWINFNLRSELSKKLQIPFYVDNDANCAALGEFWMGSGKDCSDFIFLTLGTGIGGGLVMGNKIFRGADGMAAEVGHIVVQPEGEPCGCGGRGCLEKYVSAHAAVEQAGKKYSSPEAEKLRQATQDSSANISAKLLFDLAAKGDPFCSDLFRQMGKYLGIGFVDLVHIFNMEKIVIGGGMMAAWDLLIPPAVEEMKSRAYKVPAERVKIVKAASGEDAGVLGSVYLAKTGV